MRIRDWISDVCSSDLSNTYRSYRVWLRYAISISSMATQDRRVQHSRMKMTDTPSKKTRTEEHTSELQSPMRISYAVFCLKKKKNKKVKQYNTLHSHNTNTSILLSLKPYLTQLTT